VSANPICELECAPGFEIEEAGRSQIHCLLDGTWSQPSDCVPSLCLPTQVANSDYAALGSVVGATGDILVVQCDAEFQAVADGAHGGDSATVSCKPDGRFTQMECVRTLCQ
jgi:hypothetical protein